MTSDDSNSSQPGTARPAKIRKAACGIRYDEDELQEGIDFSSAVHLKPDDDEAKQAPATPPAKSKSAPKKNR
ncbi:hypothetical protein [Marinobacter halophilus]|uniref:Uncharacterized protein n=1 Tax=Marinobacter halophilus TaxID=1323740 RepID=A0A2T1KCV6_9GAMM|nr:hypothetical protein [Marinobacter halophilus]PSF07974.1 hypothetical protein C7H08_11295 [Marinobacter halophilus]GGC58694.1 hypothetical protein GCM10011362_03880 [Marinobacter halophilus]